VNDGSILACINLDDGKRNWKGGRYGNGQLVRVPEQDLLLVLSEEGTLALVAATPRLPQTISGSSRDFRRSRARPGTNRY
jgi:outer membrane protein assembly factor BamB